MRSEILRGHDFGDALEGMILRANAFGTGLGRADAPEPVKPSRPSGCHPISQERKDR